MTGITRNSQREALVRALEAMRPTIDAVHEAMLRATEFGITYSAVAGATGTNETRAQRWSAGADIPERVGERRAILSTLARLLSDMPRAPDRRRRPKIAEVKKETRPQCIICMRRPVTDDVREICGAANCWRVSRRHG
jgi:hypothetical protein